MSFILDQADEAEVPEWSTEQMDTYYLRLKEIKGAFPLVEADPTSDQVAAMDSKINRSLQAPYADFAVFGPFGRRAARATKFRAWIPTGDGTFTIKELRELSKRAGPPLP